MYWSVLVIRVPWIISYTATRINANETLNLIVGASTEASSVRVLLIAAAGQNNNGGNGGDGWIQRWQSRRQIQQQDTTVKMEAPMAPMVKTPTVIWAGRALVSTLERWTSQGSSWARARLELNTIAMAEDAAGSWWTGRSPAVEINTLEKDLEEAVVLAAADSLDASSLKSSKELVSSNMKGKLDSIGDNLMPCYIWACPATW